MTYSAGSNLNNNNNNVLTPLKEFYMKLEIRRMYYEILSTTKLIELEEENNEIKGFNENVMGGLDHLKRQKEKITLTKREINKEIALKNDGNTVIDEEGHIQSGPINTLIAWAVKPNFECGILYLDTLLTTYRQYISSEDFIEEVINIYKENSVIKEGEDKQIKEDKKQTILKVILLLCKWISSFPHDFINKYL